MSYSLLAIVACLFALVLDIFLVKTFLILSRIFWTSYAIILPFQLLTNWWLTSRNIVIYNENSIFGLRVAAAPIEDLLFGFALILAVLILWIRQDSNE